MRIRSLFVGLAALLGAASILRMQREARKVRGGGLRALGPDGASSDEDLDDGLHRVVRTWQPQRESGAAGLGLSLWAAPLTLLGTSFALAGGRVPQWDPTVGAYVATDVGGPFRWFLRQQGASAATLGQVVVTRAADPSPVLLRHEALHARQQERLGLLFAVAYPLAGARWGYRNNPFEVAARTAARISGPAGPA